MVVREDRPIVARRQMVALSSPPGSASPEYGGAPMTTRICHSGKWWSSHDDDFWHFRFYTFFHVFSLFVSPKNGGAHMTTPFGTLGKWCRSHDDPFWYFVVMVVLTRRPFLVFWGNGGARMTTLFGTLGQW